MPGKVTDDRSSPPQCANAQVPPTGPTDSRRSRTRQRRLESESPRDEGAVKRLYTVPMMADVLGVPQAAVRHWRRGGLLEPARSAGALEWFDFQQLVVGRRLATFLAGGLSLRDIDAQLAGLAPGGAAEAARESGRIVADGRRLSIRRDNRLVGAGGQLQLGFYSDSTHDHEHSVVVPLVERPTHPEQASSSEPIELDINDGGDPDCTAELLDLAADLESAGEYAEAAEALRAVLQADRPTASVVFMLAELLYRAGDLTAARERYYAAVELDPDHLEARANLGCVLAELGEHELAIAALEGVLRQQPDYADAHWHMAGVLGEAGRSDDAKGHLRTFLKLAPASPWAKLARERLDG